MNIDIKEEWSIPFLSAMSEAKLSIDEQKEILMSMLCIVKNSESASRRVKQGKEILSVITLDTTDGLIKDE